MMNKSEKLAYQFRMTHGISDFPITYQRLLEIMKESGYKVRKYSEVHDELRENGLLQYTETFKAFSAIVNGIISVYIRDDISKDEELPITCHELGHIVLGDLLEREKSPEQEIASDEFTAYFLAPPCYLDKIGIHTLEELGEMLPYGHRLCKEIWANLSAWQQRHEPMAYEEECICKVMGASPNLSTSKSNPSIIRNYLKNPILMAVSFILFICIIFGLFGKLIFDRISQNPAHPSSQSEIKVVSYVEGEGTLVYVTTEGDKYHKFGCRYIDGKTNLIDMYISEAQDKGYQPCRICFPEK